MTAAAALVGLTLWPPASGRMLLVPLSPAAATRVAAVAIAAGAALLGRGPLPGSMVVVGDRARVEGRIGAAAIAVVAAPPAGCAGDIGTTA